MRKSIKLFPLLLMVFTLLFATVLASEVTAVTAHAATKKGWVKTGKTFYYYKNTKKVKGWQTISKKIFYFDKKGKAVTGWKKIGSKTFYFSNANGVGKKGKMLTGWAKIDNRYIYFKKTGKNGVKGQLLTGWRTIGGKRYYFKKAGTNGTKTKKLTGWQTISGKTYYFNTSKGKTDGYAYKGGTFTIGKEKCTFDKNGVLIKRTSTVKPTVTPKPTKKPTPTPKPTSTPKPSSQMATSGYEVSAAINYFNRWKTHREDNGFTFTIDAKKAIQVFNSNMNKYQDMINNYSKYTALQMTNTANEIRAMERELKVEIELVYYPEHSRAYLSAINEYRTSKGLAPVIWSDALSTAVRLEAGYNCYTYPQGTDLGCHAGGQISSFWKVGTGNISDSIEGWVKSADHRPTLEDNLTHGAVAFYMCNDEYGGVWSNAVYANGISTSVGHNHCPDNYRNLVLNCKTSSKTW